MYTLTPCSKYPWCTDRPPAFLGRDQWGRGHSRTFGPALHEQYPDTRNIQHLSIRGRYPAKYLMYPAGIFPSSPAFWGIKKNIQQHIQYFYRSEVSFQIFPYLLYPWKYFRYSGYIYYPVGIYLSEVPWAVRYFWYNDKTSIFQRYPGILQISEISNQISFIVTQKQYIQAWCILYVL